MLMYHSFAINRVLHAIAIVVLLNLTNLASAAGSTTPYFDTREDEIPEGFLHDLTLSSKVVKGDKFFYGSYTMSEQEIEKKIVGLASRLGLTIVKKSRSNISGEMRFVYHELQDMTAEKLSFSVGFPVRHQIKNRGQFRFKKTKGFKCLYYSYEGHRYHVPAAWKLIYKKAIQDGYTLTGESRQVISNDNRPGDLNVRIELQLGIE